MSKNNSASDQDFSLGDALQIAHNCTVDVTGQEHELEPGSTLEGYGIDTNEQVSLLKKDVRTNADIGLPSFNRTIDPNALREMTNQWTISRLSDVIFDFSTPTGQARVSGPVLPVPKSDGAGPIAKPGEATTERT